MRFYQFTLRFNARFLHTFCKAFESELREAVSSAEGLVHQLDTAETAQEKPSVVEALLPVLRVYGMWLAARRHEISSMADAFGGAIPAMVQNVSKIFTLLCAEYYSLENLKSCPYLLPEDIQILGFQPLNEEQLPKHCRAYCSEDGNRKPFSQTLEGCISQSSERIGRILDILRCAYFLASDSAFPMAYKVDGATLVFEYQPTAERPQAQPSPERDTPQLVDASPANDEEAPNQVNTNPHEPAMPDVTEPPPVPEQREASRLLMDSDNDIYEDSEVMDRAAETVLDMVVPFLRPPTPMHLQPRSPEESSYGMNTSTANDLFGSFRTEPSPTGSITSGKFEPLPWAWFGTPNPHASRESARPASQDAQNGRRSATHSPNASVAVNKPLEDPFATPGRDAVGNFSRNVTNGVRSPPNPTTRRSHRDQLLQAFNNSTNTPRTSSFSHWSQNPGAPRPAGTVAAPPESQNYGIMPASSGISTFSHPSSLYQGTPANGLQYNTQYTVDPGRVFRNAFLRETNQALNSHFQIEKTTSSYNDAVMRSAYQGTK